MTDLSPYQITSAKSARVMPPKVQATQSARPYYACDMSKIPAQQALRFELGLAAAWKASSRAERHMAVVPVSIENNGHRLPDVPDDATLAIMRRLIGKKPISAYMLSRAAGLTQLKCQKCAQWMVKQGEAKIAESRRGGKTIIAYCAVNAPDKRGKVEDRYTAYPITVRGVTYPSYNAAAAELGISPQTVYWHFNRGTLDTCGLGTGWKVTPTVGDDGKMYPSISKAAKASGISKQAMASRKRKVQA